MIFVDEKLLDPAVPGWGAAGILLTMCFNASASGLSGSPWQRIVNGGSLGPVEYIWPDLTHCPWSNLLLLWPSVTLLQPKSTHDAGLLTKRHAAGEEFCPMCHRPESFRTILCGTIFLSSVKVATGSRRESGWKRWFVVHLTWQLIEIRLRRDNIEYGKSRWGPWIYAKKLQPPLPTFWSCFLKKNVCV